MKAIFLTNTRRLDVPFREKRFHFSTPWRVLWLLMEEQPPIGRVAANILNKQSRAADMGWSPSLVVGEVLTNRNPTKFRRFETFHKPMDLDWSLVTRPAEEKGLENGQDGGEDYILRSFMICSSHQIVFAWSNQEERDQRDKGRVWERGH
jgi:hypothetical protein